MSLASECTAGAADTKRISWALGYVVPLTCSSSLTRQTILTFILTLALIYSLRCIYLIFIYPFYVSPLRSLPGPKDNFMGFGQTVKFLSVSWIPHLFRSWSVRWPESPFVRYLGVANAECLLVNDMTAYQQILQTKSQYFIKPEATRRIARTVIGDGLPFAEGLCHKRRRAVLTRVFSLPQIKACVPTVQAKAERLIECIRAKRSITGQIEIESLLWKAALDVISLKILGTDLEHLETNQSPLHRLFGETMQQPLSGHIIHYLSSYLPLRRILPSQTNNTFIQNCSEIRRFIRAYVKSSRKTWVAGGKKESKDANVALSLLIEQNSEWNDEEIVEYVLNLLVLGHDTTACSLVWAVHCLSTHPIHQERLRAELRSRKKPVNALSYTEIEDLRFLNNFLREVLRLYCPVAYIPREATEDVTIANTFLPKGTTVQLCPSIINLHPHIWGPAAMQFDPDRWDRLEGSALSAYAFESFHNGSRACIGKALSLMELKLMLLALVADFDIRGLGEEMEFASPSFTLRLKDKLMVVVSDL